MGFFRSLSGMVQLELVSADINSCMDLLTKHDIVLYGVRIVDELTVRFQANRNDLSIITAMLNRRGAQVRVMGKYGIYWSFLSVLRRPVLLIGLPLLLLLALFLPSRILFVEVEGNQTVSKQLIIEAAAESGICFGASRREVRSERMKNTLLEALPQLQWAGINTYGSRAVISVRERAEPEVLSERNTVTGIVAAMDGIITSCTVTRGTGLCVPGQAVKAGQKLISGYTDCGITIEATRAEGEVMAETRRELTVKTPATRLLRQTAGQEKVNFSLIIGKKRINFYNGSGISGGSCVKMYSKYVLTLPGGFCLPVTLVKETLAESKTETVPYDNPKSRMEAFAEDYLKKQMVAGEIRQSSQTVHKSGGAYCLKGIYACTEMIGVEQDEKIGDLHGETDGTDR